MPSVSPPPRRLRRRPTRRPTTSACADGIARHEHPRARSLHPSCHLPFARDRARARSSRPFAGNHYLMTPSGTRTFPHAQSVVSAASAAALSAANQANGGHRRLARRTPDRASASGGPAPANRQRVRPATAPMTTAGRGACVRSARPGRSGSWQCGSRHRPARPGRLLPRGFVHRAYEGSPRRDDRRSFRRQRGVSRSGIFRRPSVISGSTSSSRVVRPAGFSRVRGRGPRGMPRSLSPRAIAAAGLAPSCCSRVIVAQRSSHYPRRRAVVCGDEMFVPSR